MGINLQSARPEDVIAEEEAAQIAAFLRQNFGDQVPLGTDGNYYCHRDELAWSWWYQLQKHAQSTLGASNAKFVSAVDAWFGVYIDAPVERLTFRLNPEPIGAAAEQVAPLAPLTFTDKLRAALGFASKAQTDNAGREALNEMYRAYGPRAGERAVIQISSLRGVLKEAEELLTARGTPIQTEAVEALQSNYAPDARADDDPHIQCLCHLWLTATHALKHQQPMWLIK